MSKGVLLLDALKDFDVINLNVTSDIKFIFKLSSYINRSKPDAIIASMWGLTAFTAFSKLINRNKFKLLLIEHSSLVSQFKNASFKTRFWLKVSTFLAYRIADEVAGVSSGVCSDMKRVSHLNKLPTTLYNPIPLFNIEDSSTPAIKYPSTTIIAAGRLIDAKDYPTLLRAISIVNEELDVTLIILGEGPLRAQLQSMVNDYNLEKAVHFKGFVNTPREYFANADLFVLSSKREGFGNVIVEALGCGTPVVATDCNYGPSEILSDGKFGKLVPVGDEKKLADAIICSLASEHEQNKLIERAKYFAPDVVVKRYLDVLGFN
nr:MULTISPECIES: glycosyltransferase [unclassified Vibrio]